MTYPIQRVIILSPIFIVINSKLHYLQKMYNMELVMFVIQILTSARLTMAGVSSDVATPQEVSRALVTRASPYITTPGTVWVSLGMLL